MRDRSDGDKKTDWVTKYLISPNIHRHYYDRIHFLKFSVISLAMKQIKSTCKSTNWLIFILVTGLSTSLMCTRRKFTFIISGLTLWSRSRFRSAWKRTTGKWWGAGNTYFNIHGYCHVKNDNGRVINDK